jgi:peptidoglycan/LPS O-acetylase OafA/YrhL
LSQSVNNLNYIPGLNGIRALAALLVISAHWPNNMLSLKFGWIGVNIFFVLSGFLITRILLYQKQKSLKEYLADFYYKRALRIFPLYYAFLAVGFLAVLTLTYFLPQLLNNSDWKATYDSVIHDFPYYLTYTYNLKINARHFIEHAGYLNRFFSHLWSLSVEEQFYLFFPLLVYFTSLKSLKIITIIVLIACPLLRLGGVLYSINHVTDKLWFGELFYYNTLCQADALFMGAALALFSIKQVKPYLTFFAIATVWLLVGIICLVLLRKAGYFLVAGKSLGYDYPGFWFDEKTPYWFINIRPFYQYTLVNILAAALILPAIYSRALFPAIFEAKPIDYLGRISYGIYIFHAPILAILILIADINLGGWHKVTQSPLTELVVFVSYLALVIGAAHLSYQFFEKKFLKYKHRYANLSVNE